MGSDSEDDVHDEKEEKKPKYDYEAKDEQGFKKVEKQIWEAFLKAKDDAKKSEEEFDQDAWCSAYVEQTSIDEKRVNYVLKYGIYSGGRDENNERTGEGWCIFPNGDEYKGMYEGGERHGKGIYKYISQGMIEKDKLILEFINSEEYKKNPQTQIICEKFQCTEEYLNDVLKNGPYPYYSGTFEKNLKSGKDGYMKYKDGSIYIGEWKSNKRDGYGKMIYSNGDIYEGNWEQGLKHGEGVYIYQKLNCKYTGKWEKGEIVSGTWILSDGVLYHGKFEKSIPTDTDGQFCFPDSLKERADITINGQFEDGKWIPDLHFSQ